MFISKITKVALLLLVALTMYGEVYSQSGGAAAAFTRIGMSPRITGMGNAYTAGGNEGVFAYYNPALSAQIGHNQVDLSSAVMSFDRRFATLNATFPLPPSAGLSFGLIYAGVYDFDGRTQSGYHTESFSTHDLQASASFGIPISSRLAVGVAAKFQTARYNKDVTSPTSFGFDIGAIFRLTESMNIGFTVQDMISEYVWDTQDLYGTAGSIQRTEKIPVRYKFGVYKSLLENQLHINADFENMVVKGDQYLRMLNIDGPRPVSFLSTEQTEASIQVLRIGASYLAHERITARAGWQSGDLDFISTSQQYSAGFSLLLPFDMYSPSIDYAIIREPGGVSWMHMFSIRLNFNQ